MSSNKYLLFLTIDLFYFYFYTNNIITLKNCYTTGGSGDYHMGV